MSTLSLRMTIVPPSDESLRITSAELCDAEPVWIPAFNRWEKLTKDGGILYTSVKPRIQCEPLETLTFFSIPAAVTYPFPCDHGGR